MANFFLDNPDLQFHFKRMNLQEIVGIAEDDYAQSKTYRDAPVNYDDAMENYRKVLEVVGDLAANRIAPRAADVDHDGATWHDGKVTYASGTRKNLDELSQADLMGMILPRKYGGLNFPFTMYMMATEMISRADASLMNIFGLQDIGDTIRKFGNEAQREEFLPGFCTGEYTGAMALTEPDAGSDLQAVKLQAYQNAEGKWFLKGMKRFITNGNGDVLVVLARSEAGTKDGRGLSIFACYGRDGVVVRRIENKLGIHGSPTCELQFNDTPAQLVGSRKFGLIKYTIDLMYRARMGVSAQALGISQAAYEEALAVREGPRPVRQIDLHVPCGLEHADRDARDARDEPVALLPRGAGGGPQGEARGTDREAEGGREVRVGARDRTPAGDRAGRTDDAPVRSTCSRNPPTRSRTTRSRSTAAPAI